MHRQVGIPDGRGGTARHDRRRGRPGDAHPASPAVTGPPPGMGGCMSPPGTPPTALPAPPPWHSATGASAATLSDPLHRTLHGGGGRPAGSWRGHVKGRNRHRPGPHRHTGGGGAGSTVPGQRHGELWERGASVCGEWVCGGGRPSTSKTKFAQRIADFSLKKLFHPFSLHSGETNDLPTRN